MAEPNRWRAMRRVAPAKGSPLAKLRQSLRARRARAGRKVR